MTLVEVTAGFVSLSVAMAPVLIIWIRQRAITGRLTSTINGSTPEQRAELIRAWGEAENRVEGKPGIENHAPPPYRTAQETENA